jgi:hypothetical protein
MEYFYEQDSLIKYIDDKMINIKPTDVPENISEIIPENIWNCITKDVQKDIQEMYDAYYHELWTATVLMIYRILERVLKVHVEYDLKQDEVKNLGEAIKILQDKNYNEDLIINLNHCREERNNYMHGKKRANPADAKKMLGYIMSIVLQIYNIKP